ncbi:MAG: translocation/assembly module TamB domain-containing protein [Herminiimonas sp.]|nr:translocation/assembly module TamB domain-containing protein [Herminiimonas sp.]
MASDPDVKKKTRRPAWRVILLVANGLMVLTIAATGWLLGTESGARALLSTAVRLSGNALQVQGITGRLAGPLQIDRLIAETKTQRVTIDGVRFDWRPAELLHRTLHVTSLRAAQLNLTSKLQQEPTPTLMPERIDLPLLLKIDRLQIDRGTIGWGPVEIIKLGTIVLNADYDGARYRIALEQLAAQSASTAGNLAGKFSGQATLSTTRPYALRARIASDAQAMVQDKKIGAGGHVDLSGSLAEMLASVDLAIGAAAVKGRATLRPFSDKPLASANIDAQAIDLSALVAGMPHTRLDLKLSAADTGAGELAIVNPAAGLLSAQKIPLTEVTVSFRQDAGQFTFDRIRAALGTGGQSAGVITGNGSYGKGALTLALATDALDLGRLDQRLQPTQLAGTVDVRHASGKQDITLALREPLKGQNALILTAHGVLADASLAIDRAQLKLGAGQIDASAKVELAGNKGFNADGRISRFRLQDLGKFDQVPSLDLNGSFSLRGSQMPQLAADLSFKIMDSQLAGQPLRGNGNLRLRADSLLIPDLLLAAGANSITAKGELSQTTGDLSFAIAAPNLAQLGAAFSGALDARGTVKGSFSQPRLTVDWNAAQVKLPGNVRIDATQGKADIAIDRSKPLLLNAATVDATAQGVKSPQVSLASATAHMQFSPQPEAPLALDLRANGVVAKGLDASQVTVTASGTTARHVLDLAMTETAQKWLTRASGGLTNITTAPQWQGTIDRFDASGRFVARLAAPAPLLVSQQKVQLERFRLDANTVSVTVEQFLRDPRGIITRGRFDQLKIAEVLEFIGPQPALSTDLQLGGDWNINMTDTITGTVKLQRLGGDITMRGNAPVVLGLRELNATLTASNGRLTIQGVADGTRLGHIDVNGSANLAHNSAEGGANRFALAPDAAVSGSANIDVPSLAWIAPFVSPSLIADGRLRSAVSLGGTFGNPDFTGKIDGTGLRFFFTELGLDLRQGTLDAEFRDTQLLLKNLRFQTDQGSLLASGPIGVAGGKPSAQIALAADKFALLDRSDRKLILSGKSQIDWREGKAKVNGEFAVDSGSFDIGQQDAPQLSDDVVVVGRTKKSAPKVAVALDLGIDLGSGVALKGRGINANLVGKLRIQTAAGEALRANGTLNTAAGTFSAYGRELAIEQGQFRFSGPLNNPSLNILAMRRGQEVEAGVSVRGNVLAPRITLVSEPSVPDAEKLAWLVLGRGLDAVAGSELGSLQSAAGALLSQGAAAGVQSQIATAFGLDDVKLGKSQDSLQSRIVTLGKKVSSRLYVSYEQGLESASNVIHLRYTLTPRLTIEAEAGTRSALSLFYNLAFD